ncbi:MAG TPA: hypothetical protein VM759_07285, partial [Longimicrobium sp.]|nr:hypothetical protein [Longimicrobium sp.]
WVVDDGEEVHVGVGGYASRFRPAEALRRFHARVAARFRLEGAVASERRGGRIPVGGVLPPRRSDGAVPSSRKRAATRA